MGNKRRRAQKQKSNRHAVGNTAYIEAMRDIRKSNATVPVPSGNQYSRAAERRMIQTRSWE